MGSDASSISILERKRSSSSLIDCNWTPSSGEDMPSHLHDELLRAATPELSVGILLWPEFTLLALAGFIDALRLAGDMGDRSRQILCRWSIMADSPTPISSSCGIKVTPTVRLV